MIKLEKDFRKMGADFTQIYRDDELAIYKTTFPSYEIFRIKICKPDKFHNDEYEKYPSSEDFGKWAWCCSTKRSLEKILVKHFGNHPLPDHILR